MTQNFSYFCVYTDSGATFEFLEQALLPYECLNIKVKRINRSDIIDKNILHQENDKVLAVFFPGARSGQAYHDDLGNYGVQEVKDYVKNGGVYQGFCAGAYMACHQIVYRGIHSNKDVISKWDFFNGIAYGQLPILSVSLEDKPQGWQTANITSVSYQNHTHDLTDHTDVLYWGGPMLLPSPDEKLHVIARYDDIKDENDESAIAVASKSYGAGIAVFSGVHSEVSGTMLLKNPTAQAIDHEKGAAKGAFRHFLANSLLSAENGRHNLFQITMNEIFRTQRGKDHLNNFLDLSPTSIF